VTASTSQDGPPHQGGRRGGKRAGAGRPAIGGAVNVRFGADLLAMVDAYAASRGISRAEAVRRLTQDAVTRAWVNEAPLSPRDNR
jgi:hypothetical protein